MSISDGSTKNVRHGSIEDMAPVSCGSRICGRDCRKALRHFDGKRYLLDAFVVMPNHVHVLVACSTAIHYRDILHSWKSFTGESNQSQSRSGRRPFGRTKTYDRIVRDVAELEHIANYIECRIQIRPDCRETALFWRSSASCS